MILSVSMSFSSNLGVDLCSLNYCSRFSFVNLPRGAAFFFDAINSWSSSFVSSLGFGVSLIGVSGFFSSSLGGVAGRGDVSTFYSCMISIFFSSTASMMASLISSTAACGTTFFFLPFFFFFLPRDLCDN
jgi:hypothetical protein